MLRIGYKASAEQFGPRQLLDFTHLVFHFPGTDQEQALELYRDQIVPRLRQLPA